MAAAIPTTEPASITAGDTATWTRSFSDYLASDGWVLSYAFQKEGGDGQPITFSATASGSDHLVNVASTTTLAWLPGDYIGQAYVTKAGERYRVWQGSISVLLNYAAAGMTDPRSKAKRILDFIDASFEKIVQKQAVYATVDGVQLQFRSIDDLVKARNYWGIVVANERAAAIGRPRGAILARFSNPQ